MQVIELSCSNYYCKGYKKNLCKRALLHREKLYNKQIDDNYITKRSNVELCELFIDKDNND